MDQLKLTALDTADLDVISAHMQDAVIRVGDIKFLPAEQRFAIVANRFDWEHAESTGNGQYRRRRTGLHFNKVRGAQAQNIRQDDGERVISLLSVAFEGADDPSGAVTLTFSGGGSIKLDVECIEAQMSDLGPVWQTENRPDHAEAGDA